MVQARYELAASSWRVLKEVRLAWLDVTGAAAHEKLSQEALRSREKLLWVLKRRLDQGGGTQIEVNMALLGVTDARQEILRWQFSRLKAARSVAWLVGQPVSPIPSALPAAPPPLPSMDALEKRLEAQSRLEALRTKVQVTQALERNAGAKRLPWPEFQVRFRQRRETPVNNDVQVGITVPLGITSAPQLDVARALTVRALAQLEAERAQLQAELHILFSRAEGLAPDGSSSNRTIGQLWKVTARCRLASCLMVLLIQRSCSRPTAWPSSWSTSASKCNSTWRERWSMSKGWPGRRERK